MDDPWTLRGLTVRQAARLRQLYPGAVVAADHSWPYGVTVLEFVHGGRRLLLKASSNPHPLRREHRAHMRWLDGLEGEVPRLVHYAPDRGLLVKTFLPGRIALGGPRERDPEAFRQAGVLLRRLHDGTPPLLSTGYEEAMARKTRAWLHRARGLAPEQQLRSAADRLDAFSPSPVALVPTHGDYQPRNWLVLPDGRLALIDFGRAELRPWHTDLVRMRHQYFRDRPDLEAAFFDGYGPTDDMAALSGPGRWLDEIMQAIGTIVWSREMGDAAFEEHGRTMLTRILADRG